MKGADMQRREKQVSEVAGEGHFESKGKKEEKVVLMKFLCSCRENSL